jgi:BolA protein
MASRISSEQYAKIARSGSRLDIFEIDRASTRITPKQGCTIMQTRDVITKKLTEAFAPESLRVEDESHLHVGHAGHRAGGQTHYRVYIVSAAFRGKSRIDRHRAINAALAAELSSSVHALAIHATAPEEGGQ